MRNYLPKQYAVALWATLAVCLGGSVAAQPPYEVFFNYAVAGLEDAIDVAYTGDAFSAAAVRLVDEATATVDLAAYNFDHAPLASALRRAHDRGVRVRVVTDEDTSHPSLISPTPNYFWLAVNEEGLMHHKFLVADAAVPGQEAVLTGSTNFTDANIYRFDNDALLLRSPELAAAYAEEMDLLWGGTTAVPNGSRSRSGSAKPRRQIRSFRAGELRGELYFSPSDGIEDRIATLIDSAQQTVAMQLLLITDDELGARLAAADARGVDVFGVVENFDSPSSEYAFLRSRGVDLEAHRPDDIVHHKYGVFDPERGAEAVVVTGSHNWTYSARTFHDENSLVLRGSALLTELYYEAARQQHCALVADAADCRSRLTSSSTDLPVAPADLSVGPNPSRGRLTVALSGGTAELRGLRIYDSTGRPVYGAPLTMVRGARRELDLSHLPAQTYYLQVATAADGWTRPRAFQITP